MLDRLTADLADSLLFHRLRLLNNPDRPLRQECDQVVQYSGQLGKFQKCGVVANVGPFLDQEALPTKRNVDVVIAEKSSQLIDLLLDVGAKQFDDLRMVFPPDDIPLIETR